MRHAAVVCPLFTKAVCLLVAMAGLSACSGTDSGPTEIVSVQVSGTIRYEDKEYGVYGFNGNTHFKPVRHAVVDLVDDRDAVVASTETDESGHYELAGAGSNPRLRVLARSGSSIRAGIVLRDFSGNNYAATSVIPETLSTTDATTQSETADAAAGTVPVIDIDIPADSDVAGAFNMLDVFTSATQFVSELTTASMPDLNVYWVNNSSRYGTYYCFSSRSSGSCPQGKGIYILGGRSSGGDTDHYDDDVLLHEFAHYLEGMVGAQDSPGGVHYLTENDQDLRLTWSEGLGGFFPAAAKSWMKQNHPELLSSSSDLPTTYFIDTYGSYVGISIDMDNPNTRFCPGGEDCFVYSSSEIAVVKILIGLMNEYGMQAVWDTYANYVAKGTSLAATLETFWDGWMVQRSPGSEELGHLENIFNGRKVYYQLDGFETDNTIGAYRKLNICVNHTCDGEKHYLYREDLNNDHDLVAFDAQAGGDYLIETLDLSNGADTYLRILDEDGNVAYSGSGELMVNDNRPGTVFCGTYDNPCRVHNDDLMLSSELNFTPTVSGTYYVEVSASPSKPSAAGRYGTYTLQISR